MTITQAASPTSESTRTLEAASQALADAAGQLSGESRCEQAVWVADAERHMRLGTSWLARLNAATGPVLITCAHPRVGIRRMSRPAACRCGAFLDSGAWWMGQQHIVSASDLPARGRAGNCDGNCLAAWLIALQDRGAAVEAFVLPDASVYGRLVRANADSIDIVTVRGVITCAMTHVAAVRVAD